MTPVRGPSRGAPFTITSATRTERAAVWTLLEAWKPGRHSSAATFVNSGDQRSAFLLARLAGEPVGVLEGHHDWGNWQLLADWCHLADADRGSYLISLYVDPRCRSHGVGSELVNAFIGQSIEAGSPVVVTIPDEDSDHRDARLRFFVRRGFGPIPVTVPQPTWIWGRTL